MANSGNRICRNPFFTENRQESGKGNKPEMRVSTEFKQKRTILRRKKQT